MFLKWKQRFEALDLHDFVGFSGSSSLVLSGLLQEGAVLVIPVAWPRKLPVAWVCSCFCFVLLHTFIAQNCGGLHTSILCALTILLLIILSCLGPSHSSPSSSQEVSLLLLCHIIKKKKIYTQKETRYGSNLKCSLQALAVNIGSRFPCGDAVLQGTFKAVEVGH